MNQTTRQKCIAYAVTVVIALIGIMAIALRQGLSASQPFRENCRDLSDGFFVVGMLLTGSGILSRIATTGFFDIFGFGMRTLLSHFVPKMQSEEKYFDYKMSREDKRKRPSSAVLHVGLACLAASMILVWLYYR